MRRLFGITAAQQLRIRSVGSEASERVRRMRARPQHKNNNVQVTTTKIFDTRKRNNNNNNRFAIRVRVSRVRRAS